MYIEQVSLTNQLIRNALKRYDPSAVAEGVLALVHGKEHEADLLANWFRSVAHDCKKDLHMNADIAIMRMWQIGNVDIKGVDRMGDPVFILTYSGSEIAKKVSKEQLFEALLSSDDLKAA